MMRFRKATAGLLVLLLALSACSREPGASLPEGLGAFEQAFRAAGAAGDTAPMLALYHLEGTDAGTRLRLQAALTFELGLPVASIQFEPLSGAPEETIAFQHQGVAYGPSLEPRYRMRVTYATEDQLTSLFTLGQTKDGAWRIVCAAPEPAPALQKR